MSRSPHPVVDLFAGPGGLGEGFSSFRKSARPKFRIRLSIEKEAEAHRTLELRSFFRQFEDGSAPDSFYQHLRGDLSRAELFDTQPNQATVARQEAWQAELGRINAEEVDRRVRQAINLREDWVLIGGPPCQAYSLVGRARMRGADPAKYDRDPRHFLYLEYLRILARHQPAVFVMENVKGLLSATVDGSGLFERIKEDLRAPMRALGSSKRALRYELYAIAPKEQRSLVNLSERSINFVLKSEKFGIPQARHRVIVVGIREDVGVAPRTLLPSGKTIQSAKVISDLPPLRSQISRGEDSDEAWLQVLKDCAKELVGLSRTNPLGQYLKNIDFHEIPIPGIGGEFVRTRRRPDYRPDWYSDSRLGGVCNHSSRSHLREDIQRYFFAASFAWSMNGDGRSPVLSDFPEFLLPCHKNVAKALAGGMFEDRFRVQLAERPSTTITSHIAKDGHYYIHPDPLQARSLTVREAARLQTFPDNYFFCGPRTSQYQQVGNAVPPLLALQIAEIVDEVLG